MRSRSAVTTLLLTGMGLGLSACYYAPAPDYGYYNSGYYGSGYYYGAPGYYTPAYTAYYAPSVGLYYGGGWHRDWDRRWR